MTADDGRIIDRQIVLDAVELETPWGCLVGALLEDPRIANPDPEAILASFIEWAASIGLAARSGYLDETATGSAPPKIWGEP